MFCFSFASYTKWNRVNVRRVFTVSMLPLWPDPWWTEENCINGSEFTVCKQKTVYNCLNLPHITLVESDVWNLKCWLVIELLYILQYGFDICCWPNPTWNLMPKTCQVPVEHKVLLCCTKLVAGIGIGYGLPKCVCPCDPGSSCCRLPHDIMVFVESQPKRYSKTLHKQPTTLRGISKQRSACKKQVATREDYFRSSGDIVGLWKNRFEELLRELRGCTAA